ncbi:long-chain-fatty-acid--CoA ligase [Pseudalkalibacillus decolorationis]|uniref:long-chain-fatty-acid--CoA ligase n=1 Tax=Pseudalkalibacillus decolorationis TaxID=163879 RepID=UPI0021479D1A|nr:long-chain fatty acid--CoA ligase [Pseudalkalibacillus decolorationis]
MGKLVERPWNTAYQEAFNGQFEIPECSLYRLLIDSAHQYGEQTALIYQDERITFNELKDRVDRLAGAWNKLGISKGERIGLMVTNHPTYVYSYYASQKLGATVVQMNPMYTPREMEYIAHEVQLSHIVIESHNAEKVKQVSESHSFKNVFVIAEDEEDKPFGHNLIHLINSNEPLVHEEAISPKDDVAVIQFTGGTTGKMKGAMLTHYNLVANVIQSWILYAHKMKLGEEVTLTCTPLYHVYAMTSGMNLSIYIGAKNLIVPKFEITNVLEIIKEHRPTFFPGVPTMYNAFINHPDIEDYDLNCFKFCSSGSAPLPVEVIHRFERMTGAIIGEGYGMSETSPSTHRNPILGIRKVGSIGIPLPGTDCKVVDGDRNELPPGSVGELAIKGPQVMKGYWRDPDETKKTLRNGWLLTGDLASMDVDGYFYIVGRKKEMIISGGFNVYPQEVEGVLYDHPAVKEAAVIGIPHEYSGEQVKAFVVLKDSTTVTEEEIKQFCYERLTRYKVPKEIQIRESLPRNTVGKLLKRVLVEEEKQAK